MSSEDRDKTAFMYMPILILIVTNAKISRASGFNESNLTKIVLPDMSLFTVLPLYKL